MLILSVSGFTRIRMSFLMAQLTRKEIPYSTIPEGIDKSAIRPQVLVSAGAVVTPKSGELQDFTNPVEYKVVSENGENTKTYMITVNY